MNESTQRLLSPASESDAHDPEHNQEKQRKLDADVKEFENMVSKGLSSVFRGSAKLANMLPTGTVLFFQMLDPFLAKAGSCTNKTVSAAFLIICSVICFFISFTDSFQAPNGKVYHGIATFKGLWTPELESLPKSIDLSPYKIKAVDFLHAALAVLTFLTTSSLSTDVARCFVKLPDTLARDSPSLLGVFVSGVFLAFPTGRHGIGFPVTPTTDATPPSTTTPSSTSTSSPST